MIDPFLKLNQAVQEVQAAKLENAAVLNDLTKATDEFNLLTIQDWELPEE